MGFMDSNWGWNAYAPVAPLVYSYAPQVQTPTPIEAAQPVQVSPFRAIEQRPAQGGGYMDIGPGVTYGEAYRGGDAKDMDSGESVDNMSEFSVAGKRAAMGLVGDAAKTALKTAMTGNMSPLSVTGAIGNYANAASAPARNVTNGAVRFGGYTGNLMSLGLGLLTGNPLVALGSSFLTPTVASQFAESIGLGSTPSQDYMDRLSEIGVGLPAGYSKSGMFGVSDGYFGDIAARERAIDSAFSKAMSDGGSSGGGGRDGGLGSQGNRDGGSSHRGDGWH